MLIPFITLAQVNDMNNFKTHPFAYIEAGAGYDFYSVSDFSWYSGSNLVYGVDGNGSSGNVALSVAAGYQLTKHFAAEIGFIKTPKFDATYTYTNGLDDNSVKLYSMGVNPWTVYLAGKWSFPLVAQKIDGFVKLGVAYQKATFDDTHAHDNFDVGVSNNETYSPLFGAGLQYNITPKIYIFSQGLIYIFNNYFSDNGFIPINFELNHNATLLFGAGYKF